MEKPLGFSDAVASGSIKRISSFFIYMGFKSVDWIKVMYLQLIIPQYFISNKSGIWSLSLIVHSKG